MKPYTVAVGIIGLGCMAANAAATSFAANPNSALQPMPKSLEIRFALSALAIWRHCVVVGAKRMDPKLGQHAVDDPIAARIISFEQSSSDHEPRSRR
jgi:hypothetical protein